MLEWMFSAEARLALLFSIVWVASLKDPLFSILSQNISGKDIIMVGGGLFLLTKATHEIHASLEGSPDEKQTTAAMTLGMVLLQISVLDIVFSLDSVITAVVLHKKMQ